MGDAETRALYRERGLLGRVGFGARPALLVVDFIRGFTDPACALGSDLSAPLGAAAELLLAFRLLANPIHFTTICYAPGMADSGPFARKIRALDVLIEGSAWVEIDERVAARSGEPIWVKKGASAFFGTGLASALVSQGVDTVVVVGCTTSGCVRASAVDACQHGFCTIVVREAVGDRATGPHDSSLFDLDAKYADVVSLEEALGYCAAIGPRKARP